MKRRNGRRHPLSIVLYVLTGFALLLVFLPVWDVVSEYRVAILVLVAVVFLVAQVMDWERMRKDRHGRQTRWGLRR